MATPAEHRKSAEHLLETARRHALTDPARNAYLAEAQVHALLALPAPVEVKATTSRPRKAPTAKEDAK